MSTHSDWRIIFLVPLIPFIKWPWLKWATVIALSFAGGFYLGGL